MTMTRRRALKWERAIVTGASAGIGEAFARLLAAKGTALVLVARDEQRLQALADELEAAHAIDVEVLAADLADPDGVTRVAERISATPAIDLLVNNAGIGSEGPFGELPLDGEIRLVDVNVVALVRLTHAALGQMTASGSGTVLNVSSMSSLLPAPRTATYCATKAFVTSFSEALHEETRGSGVTVSAVLPGHVPTEFQERAGMSGEWPELLRLTPEAVARQALEDAGRQRALSVPGRVYRVITALVGVSPRGLVRRSTAIAARRVG
jgi:uncharacterized protein